MLSKHGGSISVIETLGQELADIYPVRTFSDKKLQSIRLIEMVYACIKFNRSSQLVLIDSYSTKAFWYTVIISQFCRILNIPYIPILHGGNFPNRLAKNPYLSKLVFKYSAINIAPSNYLKKHFEESGFRVFYLPNSLPIEKYPFIKRKTIRPKLLWVRAFHQIYNPVLAVKVLHQLVQTHPNAELCMVGPDKDGSLSEVKSLSCQLGVNKNLRITGKLSKEDWIKLSVNYDIFINTTNFDNMPVSVIEAMALGLPIVSTDAGGLPYLLENEKDGLIVEKGNVPMFTAAIKSLVNSAELSTNLSVSARRKVEEFNWDSVKSNWIDIIETYSKTLS